MSAPEFEDLTPEAQVAVLLRIAFRMHDVIGMFVEWGPEVHAAAKRGGRSWPMMPKVIRGIADEFRPWWEDQHTGPPLNEQEQAWWRQAWDQQAMDRQSADIIIRRVELS